jgi:hypothetical protein
MKKEVLAILILFFTTLINAQSLEYKNYKLSNDQSFIDVTPGLEKEDSYFILDKRSVEYYYNEAGELEEYFFVHRKTKLLTEKGIENSNKIYVAIYSPEDLLVFNARVINKTGKVITLYKGDLKTVNEDGQNYQVLAVEGLEKGSVLEYFYLKKVNTSYYSRYSFQDDIVRQKSSFEIISPLNLIFKAKSYNGFPEFKDSTANNKNIQISRAYNIEAFKDEKYCYSEKYAQHLEYKLFKNTERNNADIFTWALASKNFMNNVFEDNLNVSKEVQKELKTLTGASSDLTIQNIERFIKKNFKIADYVENTTVAKTFKQKYSTDLGLLKLYVRFFEQAKIDFELVMSSPRFTVQIDPDFETWNNLFSNYLFYFPQLDTYISPLDFSVRYPLFDSDLENTTGLFIEPVSIGEIKSGIGKLKTIGTLPVDNSYSDMLVNIHLNTDKNETDLDVQFEYAGQIAVPVRANYFYSSDLDRVVLSESWFKDTYTACTVTDVKVENFDLDSDDANKPMKMSAKVKTNEIVEKAGPNIILNVGKVIGKQEEMYQETERKLDMELGYVHTLKRKISVEIPQGYSVKNLSEFNFEHKFLNTDQKESGFVSKAEIVDNKVVITIVESYNSLKYPKNLYEPFKKIINAAADFNKLSLIFNKN